jgi:hypothetical protein
MESNLAEIKPASKEIRQKQAAYRNRNIKQA